MEKIGRTYLIPCKVNGLDLKFILDTGADNVSISLAQAIFMYKNGYIDSTDFIGTEKYQLANGEIINGTKLNIKKLEIGGTVVENIEAAIVHSLNAPMLLGQSALAALGKITIDYENNTLLFESKKDNNSSLAENDFIQVDDDDAMPIEMFYKLEIERLTKRIELDSLNDSLFLERGEYYSWLGFAEEALKDFYKGIEINPENYNFYFNISRTFDNGLNDTTSALLYLEKAKTKFNSAEFFYELASFYFLNLSQIEKALKEIEAGVKLKPNDSRFYYLKYRIKNSQNFLYDKNYSLTELISDLNLAIKYDPTNCEYYDDRAYCLESRWDDDFFEGIQNINDLELALKDRNKVLSCAENIDDMDYYSRAIIYEKLKKFKEANDDYYYILDNQKSFYKTVIDSSLLYFHIAENKLELFDTLGAMLDLNLSIKLNSSYSIVYNLRAQIKALRGDHRGAIKDWTSAILNSDDDGKKLDYYFERGNSHFDLQNFKEAITDYSKVIFSDDEYFVAYINRGLCYSILNQLDKACNDWSIAGEIGYEKAYELIREYCN